MDSPPAGISGQYTRPGNDYNQPENRAASSRPGRYRHAAVRQWDYPSRTAPGRNEFYHSPGTHSSQHLLRRSVNPAQNFNALINQEIMAGLVSKSNRFGHSYNGRPHSQYANSIKKYTSASNPNIS
ncbi:hypothetical protein [Salinisphaera sp. G21_0]|uniref:hypothetical protein n=1 Tax=Salinisphaera sp. G21_0 TaxID=2821094 RepID=UPI001ADA7D87|nr:hypothetical protein [Salinisphaera sp. G21_0]MBO9484656.1 hypothetical protein [Salinisphaera sp. G21_0]